MEIGKKIVAVITLAFALIVVVPVGAYMYFWQTEPQQIPTGIILVTPQAEMGLGIYWDGGCTQNVTTIDFGKMWHPNEPTTLTKDIYIRNEGNVSHTIYWNSTLSSETENITDRWIALWHGSTPLNETAISPGQTLTTNYHIDILVAYAPVGQYNWTLTVWAEHVH
jgi:hypothetical protein